MKRVLALSLTLVTLVAAGLGLSACQKKVEVQTGTKVVCSYGHTVSDDVRTIGVAAAEAANHKVKSSTVVCDRHKKLESLYGDAQKAIAAGDLEGAKTKLTEVVALDKAFGKAKAQLDEIAGGKKPAADTGGSGGTGGTTTPKPKPDNPGEDDTSGPSGSLKVWTPDTLTGFTAQKPSVDVLSIARNYTPQNGSKAFTFVIVAEQFRTAKDAASAVGSRIKARYPDKAATLKINGHSAYFGTDGKQFAAVGFTDGSIMIALEMSARDGVAPHELRGLMESVLKQLP